MTKEELEIEHKELKQRVTGLEIEYGKLLARYRVIKAMVHGVMKEVDEPITQFHQYYEAGAVIKPTKKS